MDPTRLSRVLSLHEGPQLRPATIIGYRLMLWGPYPALIDAPGESVNGMVYMLQSKDDAAKLQRYETSNYRPHSCLIDVHDGAGTSGETFIWAGDKSMLASTNMFYSANLSADRQLEYLKEGTFDLPAWQVAEYGKAFLKQSKDQKKV